MQNMHEGFCLVIIFFCSGSHSKGWMGRVLNCILKKRTEWALWIWHKSKGESTINVNAFCVTYTSLVRPHLLLSTESVNRFPCSLVAWTYLLPMITLKGFFCPQDVSLCLKLIRIQDLLCSSYSPFNSSDLVWINRGVGMCWRCWRDVFWWRPPHEPLVRKNALWSFFLSFCHTYSSSTDP